MNAETYNLKLTPCNRFGYLIIDSQLLFSSILASEVEFLSLFYLLEVNTLVSNLYSIEFI